MKRVDLTPPFCTPAAYHGPYLMTVYGTGTELASLLPEARDKHLLTYM